VLYYVWSDIQNTIRSKYIWPSQRKRWNCSGNFGRFSQNCKHIDLKLKQEAAIRQDGLAIQIFQYLWEWRRKFHNLLHAFSWSYSLLHLYICHSVFSLSTSTLLCFLVCEGQFMLWRHNWSSQLLNLRSCEKIGSIMMNHVFISSSNIVYHTVYYIHLQSSSLGILQTHNMNSSQLAWQFSW